MGLECAFSAYKNQRLKRPSGTGGEMAESVKELVAYGFIEGAPDFIFYNYLLHKPHTQIETKSSFCALFRRGVTFVHLLLIQVPRYLARAKINQSLLVF